MPNLIFVHTQTAPGIYHSLITRFFPKTKLYSMSPEEVAQQIRELVEQDKLTELVQLIRKAGLGNDGRAQIAMISEFKRRDKQGILSYEQRRLELSKIRRNLLEIADMVEEEILIPRQRKQRKTSTKLKSNRWKQFSIIGLGILLLGGSGLFLFQTGSFYAGPPKLFLHDSTYHILLLPFGNLVTCDKRSTQISHLHEESSR